MRAARAGEGGGVWGGKIIENLYIKTAFCREMYISIFQWENGIGDAARLILSYFAKCEFQFYCGNMTLETQFVGYCCILQNESVNFIVGIWHWRRTSSDTVAFCKMKMSILRWEYDIGNAIRPILLHFAKCRCLFS